MRIIHLLAVMVLAGALPVMAQGFQRTFPEGPFTEPATGMMFPVAVDDFRRIDIIKYNPDGSDESGGYNRNIPGQEIAATVYVYPSPPLISIASPPDVIAETRTRLCAAQFQQVEHDIMAAHLGATRVSAEPARLEQQGEVRQGLRAVYRMTVPNFAGRHDQPVQSEAYLFCYAAGKWSVKYRFTYPVAAEAAGPIAAFMQGLKWTLGDRI